MIWPLIVGMEGAFYLLKEGKPVEGATAYLGTLMGGNGILGYETFYRPDGNTLLHVNARTVLPQELDSELAARFGAIRV